MSENSVENIAARLTLDEKEPNDVEQNGKEEEEEGDDDDDADDESDDEPIRRKAPLQLLVETVAALVRKEYAVARKLCQMILLYDPYHAEAIQLMAVIDEKQKLDEAKALAGQNEETDDDDTGEDSSSSDEDDNSDDDDDDYESDITDESSSESSEEANQPKASSVKSNGVVGKSLSSGGVQK